MCISSMLDFSASSASLLPKIKESLTDSSLRPHLYSTRNECGPSGPTQAIWSFSVRCHKSICSGIAVKQCEACQHRPPIRHFPTDRSSLPDLSPAAWSTGAINNEPEMDSERFRLCLDLVQGQILANELGSGLQRSTHLSVAGGTCKDTVDTANF